MANPSRLLLACCLVGTGFALVAAEPRSAPQDVINRAIRAHGGATKLKQYPALTWQGTGMFYGTGRGLPYAVVGARQHADQGVLLVELDLSGQKAKRTTIINRDRGWIQVNDRIQEMTLEMLAEEKERLHANCLASLVPFLEPGVQLRPGGVGDVNGRPADGVLVSRPDHRDATLYFDRESGLLLKKVTRVRDLLRGGAEVLQETYYSNFQKVLGVQLARRIQVQWDGKPYLDVSLGTVTPREQLPETMFFRPTPLQP